MTTHSRPLRRRAEPGEGGLLAAQVHQLAGRLFSRILREHGLAELNPAQGRILHALRREEGLTQAQLADRTKLDKSTLTLMLGRLETAGQIRRKADPADARLRRVHLSARSRRLHAAYLNASKELQGHCYRGLKGPEIAAFEATLRKLIANLEDALAES